MQTANEKDETFELSSMSSIEQAVTQIMGFLGMAACEKTDKVNAEKSSHTLLLSVRMHSRKCKTGKIYLGLFF